MIERIFHLFERSLAAVLLFLIGVVSIVAVGELCFILYQDMISGNGLLLSLDEMFEVLGMFLIVLIVIEFMASIYMYMKDKAVHVEMMLLIAITALTRKVVVLDSAKAEPLYIIALAVLLGTLVVGYYLVKRLGGAGAESRAGH